MPDVTRLRRAAVLVLSLVAASGAVLSYSSLYDAADPIFGPLAYAFPLLVDALCLGASLAYAAGAKVGRPRAGWRLTAHAAAAGTVALNALASPDLGDVPWHITAPLTWSVLVELTGRELLGAWRAEHVAPRDRIPGRLWLTAPVESARTWLLMARTGAPSHAAARVDVGVHAAAVEALRWGLPGWGARRVRRVLGRQLRAGSLDPAAVLAALGWGSDVRVDLTPDGVMRAALAGVLDDRRPVPVMGGAPAVEAAPTAPEPAPTPTLVVDHPTPAAAPVAARAVTPDADLEQAARAAADRIRAEQKAAGRPGQRIGGPRLAAALRQDGHQVGSRRLPALVALVNDDTPAAVAGDQDDEQEQVA